MDDDNAFDVSLLGEVFEAVEKSETVETPTPPLTAKGFLEDVVNLERKTLLNSKSKTKKKPFLEKFEDVKNSNEDKSVIHEGLTDSSDDEENKYFEETNYNECGRNLKKLMKQKTSSNATFFSSPRTENSKKLDVVKENIKTQLNQFNEKPDKNVLLDPILGMHIINPLLSSEALKRKLLGRVSISVLNLKKFLETPSSKDSDWITGGAVVSKFSKVSQKGNQYCIWHITDLRGDIKTFCVFLFGSAYKEYWKTPVGTVVGILNPFVMDNKEKSEATLRVDNADKILIMGVSKDYGLCKSKKKNGEDCLSVVNKSKCEYCLYHIKKEYNKACRRSDLQPPKIGRSLDNLRAKVLGKNKVFYNGKTFTGVTGKKSTKQTEKDVKIMKLLSQTGNQVSKQKDESILKKLSESPLPPIQKSAKVSSPPESEPKMIDLNFVVSKKDKSLAKANALKYIREHGPIKSLPDKNKKILSIKRKIEESEEKETKKPKTSEETIDPIKQKYLKNGITEDFLKLMNTESRLTKMAEDEEREKYFNKLEIREKIETKMASTFKVECKAVRCLKCNYKSFSASELCKKEKHPLKVVNAVKRFWKCGDCYGRTVCLELVPLHACKTCGSSKWERASMLAEKKDLGIITKKLSLRGDEEKNLGAVSMQANLNLLVPEEAS